MKKYNNITSMCKLVGFACTYFLLSLSNLCGMSFDDIHHWIGSGTNEMAVVIDWNNGDDDASYVWGYRWNGDDINMTQVLKDIAEEDKRFSIGISTSMYGSSLDFIGYDKNDTGCVFYKDMGRASIDGANCGLMQGAYYWSQTKITSGRNLLDYTQSTYYPVGLDGQKAENGIWWVAKYINWMTNESSLLSYVPHPAFSPYAFNVVSSFTEETSSTYNDVKNVVGRPASYMNTPYANVVCPVNPVWGGGSLFSIVQLVEEDVGYVTIEFDHKVVDDESNPFGLDFTVFGNSFISIDSAGEYFEDTTNPNNVKLMGKCFSESAVVEVSADGVTWYEVSQAGRYADDFAPTLGLVYDEVNPDTTLYEGNNWWGKKSDATYPLDPRVKSSDVEGLTLAELCKRYNGSAGGVSFDISSLDLPRDEYGRKWIKFVRVKPMFTGEYDDENCPIYTQPDIDAFADIAPVDDYRLWQTKFYTWDKLYDEKVSGQAVVAENGLPNYVNAALDKDPTDVNNTSVDLSINSFIANGNDIVLKTNQKISELLVLESCSDLSVGNWKRAYPRNGSSQNEYVLPITGDVGFFRLRIQESK